MPRPTRHINADHTFPVAPAVGENVTDSGDLTTAEAAAINATRDAVEAIIEILVDSGFFRAS